MYLIDTNIISEARKGRRANTGVRRFFLEATQREQPVFLSAITIGELRRGIDLIRYRGDLPQARRLEDWLETVVSVYTRHILSFDQDAAQIWGRLRCPDPHNLLDKQIAAIALLHGLTVVTRNTRDFAATGVALLNPFH